MSTPSPAAPLSPLNDDERQRVAARFERQRAARAALAAEVRRSRRLRQLLAVLGALGTLLAVWLFLHFNGCQPSPPVLPPPPLGALAPDLGALRVPLGTSVPPAVRLAPLVDLATGSSLAQETQVLTATEGHLPIEVRNSIGMRLRLIPAGTALIGSPLDEPGHRADEHEHGVELTKPFYLGAEEVTQGQWEAIFGAGSNPSANRASGPNVPVETVTWDQCNDFCARLAAREHLPPRTYRLPHEAEWEYAARAGTTGAYYFAGGAARLAEYEIFRDNGPGYGRPVGARAPNAWGLHDLLGNVWEWCDNYYYDYQHGVAERTMRSLRGGNFHSTAEECRVAARYRLAPNSSAYLLGFRVLRTISSDTLAPLPDALPAAAAVPGTPAAVPPASTTAAALPASSSAP